jgi:hypothetical protein
MGTLTSGEVWLHIDLYTQGFWTGKGLEVGGRALDKCFKSHAYGRAPACGIANSNQNLAYIYVSRIDLSTRFLK